MSREEIVASNWIGDCILLALVSLGGCVLAGFDTPIIMTALVFGRLVIPTAGTFKCASGWPRMTMAIYTGLMAAAGIAALAFFFAATADDPENARRLRNTGGINFGPFRLGAIGCGSVANFLIARRPKR